MSPLRLELLAVPCPSQYLVLDDPDEDFDQLEDELTKCAEQYLVIESEYYLHGERVAQYVEKEKENNGQLSDEDKALMAKHRMELDRCDARLDEIADEYRAVEFKIRRQKYRASILRAFPLELLGEIILFATEATLNSELEEGEQHWTARQIAQRERRQILHLTHVCYQWRQAALSTPAIWSTFKAEGWSWPYYESPSYKDAEVWLKDILLMEFWFKRAGTRPKSLTVAGRMPREAVPAEYCTRPCPMCIPEMQDIIGRFYPWKSLRLEHAWPTCIERFGDQASAKIPEAWHSIQALTSYDPRDDGDGRGLGNRVPNLAVPSKLPPIRNLETLNLSFEWNFRFSNFSVPVDILANLLHLDLTPPIPWVFSFWVKDLQACRKLQSLRLLVPFNSYDRDEPGEPIYVNEVVHFPSLKNLHLVFSRRGQYHILDRMHCPLLTNLKLHVDGKTLFADIHRFIEASACTIEALSLVFDRVKDSDLVELLTHTRLRDLQSLNIEIPSTSNTFGNLWQYETPNGPLDGSFLIPFTSRSEKFLPHLEEILLTGMDQKMFRAKYFVDFTNNRRDATPASSEENIDNNGGFVEGMTSSHFGQRTMLKRAELRYGDLQDPVIRVRMKGATFDINTKTVPAVNYIDEDPWIPEWKHLALPDETHPVVNVE